MPTNVAVSPFGLTFLYADSLENFIESPHEQILGVAAYGLLAPLPLAGSHPFAWVEMPVIGGDIWYEVWTARQPVTLKQSQELRISCAGDILYGSLALDEEEPGMLEATTRRAYSMIFDTIDREGYPHLHRVWNYFPRINEVEQGMERYRSFSMGRYDAFTDKGRGVGANGVPAACALGSRRGQLIIYFIAGKAPCLPLENPRQTSAYFYPPEFGPRSPTFSRAILLGSALLISGTASIVGYKTVHSGEVLKQLDETIANLRTVLGEAKTHGFSASNPAGLHLKVYLRHTDDYPEVRKIIEAEFGYAAHVVYLHAEVCRTDLMVEIEATWIV